MTDRWPAWTQALEFPEREFGPVPCTLRCMVFARMTFAVPALIVLAAVLGCHQKQLSEPTNHRPVAVACAENAPCTQDSDCSNGGVCACGEGRVSNRCLPAGQTGSCRVDSDCGAGEFCSRPDRASEDGYFCHGADDTCGSDADCSPDEAPFCLYDRWALHWRCTLLP